MGHQKGAGAIRGRVGNLVYYETQDGKLVRDKGSHDRNRIMNDPAFSGTRKINMEFGNAARAVKLLRTTVKSMGEKVSDNRVIPRLTKVMTGIKDLDVVSARGKRTVGSGIVYPAARGLMKGFNFNANAILHYILKSPYTVAAATGVITIPDFIPSGDVRYPKSATHLSLQAGFAHVDFGEGAGELQVSNVVNIPIDDTSTDVVLVPAVPTLKGTSIYLLKVYFFQLVNGVQYPLNVDEYNSMEIVEVV